jgi:hypothetical protein
MSLQQETEFRVPPATPAMQGFWFESETIGRNETPSSPALIRGNRNPTRLEDGNFDIGGDISMYLMPYPAQLFFAVLGECTTTEGTGADVGKFTHVCKVGTTLPSYTVEKGFPDIGKYFSYNGSVVNKVGLDLTSAGPQKMTVGIIACKEVPANATLDASRGQINKRLFTGRTMSVIKEGGATIANCLGISGLSIDNQCDGSHYFLGDGGNRGAIDPGVIKVTGTLRALFRTQALYDKAVAGTESSIEVGYAFSNGTGGFGSESINILMPELRFIPRTPTISGPKGILTELPFEAYYYNSAAASSIVVTIKNTQAAIKI